MLLTHQHLTVFNTAVEQSLIVIVTTKMILIPCIESIENLLTYLTNMVYDWDFGFLQSKMQSPMLSGAMWLT